ncbi:MAG: 4-aminobutyrate--2-oxoglutarate transaminase [Candidatus Wallbacteria bacterium]|nr:4-aminobutyrate--2-oxoglutarate transaminase [Candidatus Wallbacteria bacterium]
MGVIHLKTEIPGPKSREILARRAAAVCAGLGKATDVVLKRGRGAVVEDVDGNTLLDLAGGIGMLAVGHSPPEVVEAIHAQAQEMIHPCALVATYESYIRVCELLNELVPGDFPKKSLLANTGAEAVENAVKVARAYTGRPAVICFEGAYHGRTLLTMTLTSKYSLFKKGFGPFAPEIYRLPAPNVYRTPAGMTSEQYVAWCCSQLENAFVSHVDPSAVAAILVEPVQGEAGFIPLPHTFLAKIRELCDRHGIVMIADEVQSGFGRTGKMFAIEHYPGVVPDLVTTAKSIAAGMPISAVTGRASVVDATHLGGVGGTFGGAPLTCAAAIAAIEMIRQPAFLAHAERLGQQMRSSLEELGKECSLVGDVRGLGAMMLVELVLDREKKTPAVQETLEVIKRSVAGGTILIRAGLYSNCVRLLPPLVISESELDEGLQVLRSSIRHVAAQVRPS